MAISQMLNKSLISYIPSKYDKPQERSSVILNNKQAQVTQRTTLRVFLWLVLFCGTQTNEDSQQIANVPMEQQTAVEVGSLHDMQNGIEWIADKPDKV
ncbi:unnamed protein product [Arctia plantaginis]|uniref:Uncharacterized protein n=1 Tax=Arctia plantaginis TaxID=874455 RepID=A0A8S0Z8S6_ARCPL|nr:unnamed protein product [Arctia plantaginis]